MEFSRWCYIFYRNGVSALVNSLTLEVVYIDSQELDIFMNEIKLSNELEKSELGKFLISQGLLVENRIVDEKLFTKIRNQLKSEISLELLYLLVTDGCNLRCVYCFEEVPLSSNNKFRATQMSEETVIKSLDIFAMMAVKHGDPNKKKVIHLYGGEPLANRKAVYKAILYIDNLKKKNILPNNCQIVIVTNGVLLTDKDVQFFAKNNVDVGLSIDGPESVTNFYRISKRNNINVMDKITYAFRLLKNYGVNVGLSVTLTPLAIEHFDNFLSFFSETEFRSANGMSLNLLHYTPNIKLPDNYYFRAVECQIKAFKMFRKIGFYEERVMRKVKSFIDQKPMYADCGVVGYQLVVAPDGLIGVCQDFVKTRSYFSRSVYDENHNDLMDTLFANWHNRSPFFMPQCIDCPALGICGGGCPASAEIKTGDRNNLDERACYHSKQILEWLIWDAYEKQL